MSFHRIGPLLGAAAAIAILAIPVTDAAAKPQKKSHEKSQVTVMTRNVAIGSDLGPGLTAGSLQELSNRAGQFLHEVAANDFATRAKGLAAEIRKGKPDLVGLQEVASWRTADCGLNVFPPKATTNLYDYLSLLLDRLNRGDTRYRPVVVQPEFDFEVPVNVDGNVTTGTDLGAIKGCETNARLTIRDVILARRGVKTSAPTGGNFENPLKAKVGGVSVALTRGWTRVDAKVKGAPKFRFVNTQLEAFDDETAVPSIRALQAGELFAPGGPATGRLPVILVGDLNSDVRTAVEPGDAQAFQALLNAGFRPRSTWKPLDCCITTYPVLTAAGGGNVSQFNHKTDHVMTNAPGRIKLVESSVTGRRPVNGFWSSDHAGVVSTLKIKARK
jgi:endonuclease/exonuclease/phosphatase family metal-dependent hydrolase